MSDSAELWRAIDEENKQAKDARREQAHADYPDAALLAIDKGMALERHPARFEDVAIHYTLTAGNAVWQLYPGNQRVYVADKKKTPYLKLPKPWRLVDMVIAAARAKGGAQ